MDALNQITEGMTGQEVAQIIYQNDSNSLTDYIVSYLHPTEGVNGTNVYTLTTAIAKIPQDIRKQGITCTFLSINGWLSYKYIGNTITNDNWNTTSNWILIATEKELSNLATQNSMMHLIESNKTVNVSFDEANTSVTISLPSGLFLSYGNIRIADSATTNGQTIIDPMTSGKLKYLVYNLSENQYKLVDYADQMNNSVLVGWVNQYLKEAILRCNKYVVNGIPQSFNDYIPKTNIAHDLTTTDTNKVLGADQAVSLATQNGFMQCANPGSKVEVNFNANATEVTISLPSGLYVSYGNNRINNAATENGTVITSTSADSLAKYLVYNLATNSFEIVKYNNQMKNCILGGWIYLGASIRSCTLLCDKYSIDGKMVGNQSLSDISYANIPTTIIQLKKYADDGYALLQLTSSFDTEVKITGGYVSLNTTDFTETSVNIKKEASQKVYFTCTEQFAIIEAKGVYNITISSNVSNCYVSQSINDFGDSLTQLISNYSNGLSGEIKDFNRNMTNISISGGNISMPNISGEFKDLPRLLTYLLLGSSGISVAGDVADLPRKLTYLALNTGPNSRTTGNVADLPRGLTSVKLYNLTKAFTGDIKDFPPNSTEILAFGAEFNIYGDIKNTPSTTTTLQIGGLSTVTGNIADIPRNISNIMLYSGSNIYGNLSEMPSTLSYFRLNNNKDGEKIMGDIGDIPNKSVVHVVLIGNIDITFDKEFPLSSGFYRFELSPDANFPIDSPTVDKILTTLDAKAGIVTGTRFINLVGSCATPTEASQAAITSLQQKGFTVQTN